MMLSDVCLSVCLSHTSGLSREQAYKKTKMGTEVAHVTRDSDTTFKVKRSKVKVTGGGALWRAPPAYTACLICFNVLTEGALTVSYEIRIKRYLSQQANPRGFRQFMNLQCRCLFVVCWIRSFN